MKNTKKKGFTIVELVIVIAVIGILSAILIPTFSGLVQKAQDAALQENLRNAYVEYTSVAATGDYKGQDEVYFVVNKVVYEYNSTSGEYGKVDGATVSEDADAVTVTQNGYTYTQVKVSVTEDSTTRVVTEFNGYTAFTRVAE